MKWLLDWTCNANGNAIYSSYLDGCQQNQSRHSRQKYLRENYLFSCQCPKCAEQAGDPDVTSDEEMDSSEEEEDQDEQSDWEILNLPKKNTRPEGPAGNHFHKQSQKSRFSSPPPPTSTIHLAGTLATEASRDQSHSFLFGEKCSSVRNLGSCVWFE